MVDLSPESIMMVEESFSLFKVRDITSELLAKDGYVASFNVPYDSDIYA